MPEFLEARQLLSSTNDAADGAHRDIVIRGQAANSLEIVDVRLVNDSEIRVLVGAASFDPYDQIWHYSTVVCDCDFDANPPEPVLMDHEISFRTDVTDVPVRLFYLPNVTSLEDPNAQAVTEDDFYAELADTSHVPLFDVTDPELAAWRAEMREALIAAGDEKFGDLFGTASNERPEHFSYPYRDGVFILLATGETTLDDASAARFETDRTNTQFAGIDEADIIETDGRYLYVLTNSQLVILDIQGDAADEPVVVSRTQFDQAPQEMYLHDGRLTLIQPIRDYGFGSSWGEQRTQVRILDVADPTEPAVVSETTIDGRLNDSRMIDGRLYFLVVNQSPFLNLQLLEFETVKREDSDTGYSYIYETRDSYSRRIDAALRDATFPGIESKKATGESARTPLIDDDYDLLDGNLWTFVRIDTTASQAGVVDTATWNGSHSWDIGASSKLYMTNTAAWVVTGSGWAQGKSRIEKIDLTAETMQHVASGTVDGYIDSVFSVDEYNGYLRIATTNRDETGVTSNNLFVLQQTDDQLEIVGRIEGLAPTELIYSMRFDGDRAWMVTFRQIDPVFSFDLSDPTNPRLTGELKIPGFSEYLQLIDDDLLLAVGRGATEQGLFQEVQVSLFDISDMEDPTLLHRYSFENGRRGSSEALHEHLAFNYIPDHQILAIPFQESSWDWGWIVVPFNDVAWERPTTEIAMLHIDRESGIQRIADIEQPGSARRSVEIDGLLYSVSELSVAVVDLNDPETVIATVSYNEEDAEVFDYETLLNNWIADFDFTLPIEIRTDSIDTAWPQIEWPANAFVSSVEIEVMDANGDIVYATTTDDNSLNLRDILSAGRFTVHARAEFANGEFSDWTNEISLNVVGRPDLEIQDNEISWTDQNGTYEVWVNDRRTGERVFHDTDFTSTSILDARAELLLNDVEDPGDYDVWVRTVLPDGSKTDWSTREILHVFGDAVAVHEMDELSSVGQQTFSWDAADGVDTYELYIRQRGELEPIYRETVGSSLEHTLSDNIPVGDYQYWIRGLHADGGKTRWGQGRNLTVSARPSITIDDSSDTITWTTPVMEDAETSISRHEIWVNRIDEFVARRIYETDLDAAEFNMESLEPGEYEVWTRTVHVDVDGEVPTPWSASRKFSVTTPELFVGPLPLLDEI